MSPSYEEGTEPDLSEGSSGTTNVCVSDERGALPCSLTRGTLDSCDGSWRHATSKPVRTQRTESADSALTSGSNCGPASLSNSLEGIFKAHYVVTR